MDMQSDFDRILFFEHARKKAQDTYDENPLDAMNLTRWGGALLELAQYQNVGDSKKMVIDGIAKMEEAHRIEPEMTDTLWSLGNAYTSLAFLTLDEGEANKFFGKGTASFQQAVDKEPGNELYQKSLEVAAKAPELRRDIHRVKQGMGGAPAFEASTSTASKSSEKKGSNDLLYNICGWVILVVGFGAWVGFAKSHMQ